MMTRCFLVLVAVAILIPGVRGQQCTLSVDTTIFLRQTVVVTAQRMETNQDKVAEAVSVMDRNAMIRLSPLSAPDALAAMPGVWMQKTNHGGGSPFIRGLTGYHTLLLVDGIRFNNSTFRSGPNQYLNTLDPFTIQRVEVLRGQGSVQYGSDGIGGVAQIFFRDPEYGVDRHLEAEGRVYGQVMSQDMQYAGRVEASLGNANVALRGGVSYKQFGNIRAGKGLGTLYPTAYQDRSWDVKARGHVGSVAVTAAWQHQVQTDVPLYHQLVSGNYARYHFSPQARDLGYVRIETAHDLRLITKIRYTLAYLNSLEEREKQRSGSSVIRFERDRVDTYHGAVEIVSDFSSRWQASSGVEVYQDHIASSASEHNVDTNERNTARGLYPDGTRYLNMALFSIHNIDFDYLSVSFGARYNLLRLQVDDPLFGATVLKPQAAIGNVGLVFRATRSIQLIASANTGFRAPNVNDVASFGVADYRYEVPNYALRPEKSFQYQVGIRHGSGPWKAEIYFYQNRLSGLITNVGATYNGMDSVDGFKVFHKENVNKARVQGVEATLSYRPAAWMSAFANFTYTIGENLSQDEPMSRIPPFFGQIGTDINFGKAFVWRTELLGAATQDRLSGGDKQDSRIPDGGTPGWVVVNTRLEYVHRKFRINAGLQNILNEAYRTHGSGIDGVGRSFWVAVVFSVSNRS